MKSKDLLVLFVVCIIVISISGCAEEKEETPAPTTLPTTTTPTTLPPTTTVAPTTTPPTTTPVPTTPSNTCYQVEDVINAFKDAGLPIGVVVVYDEATDPNSLLGRPNQYIAKASWEDTRIEQYGDSPRGGTVEIFDSTKALNDREEYLEQFVTMPMFLQYMYKHKNMLVRIEGDLTPSQAKEYENILNSL